MSEKPKKKWNEVRIEDYSFDGHTLLQHKREIEQMIDEYGADAEFNYTYSGYSDAYEIQLIVEVEEDESTYLERIHQERLDEQRALAKKEKKAREKADKLAKELAEKEQIERELLKTLQEKYGS